MVLLHGFAGTHRAWDGVLARLPPERYRPLAPDLPGHGAAADAGPVTFAGCVEHVLALAPETFVLCGYSLGGRIALHVALGAPERVRRLVLVSASPGIESAAERARRREADRRLADELEHGPFDAFVERWAAQPLFAADPPEVGELVRADQCRNDPRGLARALRGIGAGEMEPLWAALAELAMRVQLVVGERDDTYRAIAARMLGSLPDASLHTLPGGHRVPLESPAALAELLATTDPR